MTESIYKEYENKYYNPNDNDKKPGDNDNWKSIQKGFHDIGSTQLETSAGLTLGKGTADETSVTAGELEEIKNPSQLETTGGLTLGKGTADEVSVTAAELATMKEGVGENSFLIYTIDGLQGESIKFDYTPIDIETLKTQFASKRVYSIDHTDDGEGFSQTLYTLENQIIFFDQPQVHDARIYMPGVTYTPTPELTANVKFVASIGSWYITDEGYLAGPN